MAVACVLSLISSPSLLLPSPPPAPAVTRRSLLGLGAAAAFASPSAARAWCGEQVPSWAFYLKWDETAVPFKHEGVDAQLFLRIVGDRAREDKTAVPPVVVLGTPGLGYDYLENLEALTVSDRRVAEVVCAGTQRSAGEPLPASLLTQDACAAQLLAAVRALSAPKVHVVAHGLGAVAALRLLQAQPALVRSLTLISPYGGLADLRADAAQALVKGVESGRAAAAVPTVSGTALGSCVAEATGAAGGPLLGALLGSADAERLGGARLGARLDAVAGGPPVQLMSGGASDIVETSWEGLPSAVKRVIADKSGHLPFVEQRESFLLSLLEFLDEADGVETNRELKFGAALDTIKELSGS